MLDLLVAHRVIEDDSQVVNVTAGWDASAAHGARFELFGVDGVDSLPWRHGEL